MNKIINIIATWIVNGMAICVGLWFLYVILMAILNTFGLLNI